MRVVHVITGLKRGGAEGALYRLLAQEDVPSRARVVSLTDGGVFQARLEALGVEVTCLDMRPGLPSPFRWWRLVGLLRQWRPDVVQTWMYHSDLVGGFAAKAARIPVCWGVRHSNLSTASNKTSTLLVVHICAWVSRWVAARAISCSARAAEVHRAVGYAVPFEVVPNGLDMQAWTPQRELSPMVRAELGISDQMFVFAHASRCDPQKDHVSLAKAFSRVHAACNDARLIVCGDGLASGNPYFEGLPFSATARAAVIALGPRDDLSRLWQAADAFVLSSVGEGFPNVLVEAMACGLPCVTTDVGDAAEIVSHTGKVVPPQDSEALMRAMQAILEMPYEERVRLGAAARARVQERFTVERMAAGFRRVWSDVITEDAS